MSAPRGFFHKFAHLTSRGVGSPWAFIAAVLIILAWGITGPLFKFSDTWQLVINTGTTIVTFLMVFLIQNTQNRDAIAIHLKLDELIRALKGARNKLVDLEELSDEELEALQEEFRRLGAEPPAPIAHRRPRKKVDDAEAHSPLERAERGAGLAEEHGDPNTEEHGKHDRKD